MNLGEDQLNGVWRVACLAVLWSSAAQAGTIRVPEDYSTVLAAVDAAAFGDSVLIGAGTWTAVDTRSIIIGGFPRTMTGCAFPGGGVTIIGAGMDVTILDPSVEDNGLGLLRTVTVGASPGDGGVVIEGLTFRSARRLTDGGALAAIAVDEVTVRSCRFTDNGAEDLEDSGLEAVLASREGNVTFEDCLIDRNRSRNGSLYVLESDLTLLNCRFEDNEGKSLQYDANDKPGYALYVEGCEFVRGRGIRQATNNVQQCQEFIIRECLFAENVNDEGAGAALRVADSTGLVEFCVFDRDSVLASNASGAGLRWEAASGVVRNCTFVACHAILGGAAFGGAFGGTVIFQNNLVTHSSGGGALRASQTTLLPGTGCNIFWANQGGDYYGEWPVRDGDEVADPEYCGFTLGDFSVQKDSPCLVGPCAPVGAVGQGCGTVSVEASSWARIKSLYRDEGGGQ
jgi:hypothetical protein